MPKRSHVIAFEEVIDDIDKWLGEQEDTAGDNLVELYGDEASQSSESESEQSETEDIIIPKKVLKRKMLTRKRMVNLIPISYTKT